MFSEEFNKIDHNAVRERIYTAKAPDPDRLLSVPLKKPDDIISLFSPAADSRLEELAELSSAVTRRRFGNTIQLYAPLYISNECANRCVYCGFNADNPVERLTLSMEDRLKEARLLRSMGFRHILFLTGEHRGAVPPSGIAETAAEFKKIFSSVSIEVYPMEAAEYAEVIAAGADGLTIYQETYDPVIYSRVHPEGLKSDFVYRLNSPDRGGIAGFRRIGIGALLGLSDWRVDGFYTALHALYLSKKYWRSQINVSFPRITSAAGSFVPEFNVSDRDLVHLICAMRIILPDSGLVLSTREPQKMRDNLIPLGITMMSAGSKTDPGGYSAAEPHEGQFTVEDIRTPAEISETLKRKGFDPVWKDWDREFI